MEIRVEGKVLLVTGGTQGVGKATAIEAARSGAAGVMLTGRDEAKGAAVVAELEAVGVPSGFVAADLAAVDAAERIVGATLARFGRVDGLVSAGASTDRGSVEASDAAFFDRMFAINTRAPMLLMQAVIRHLRERRAQGSIVTILSVNVHGGTPELAVYAASKAATALLTKNAAYTHRHDRIRVNGINLGWADTPGERDMQGRILGKGEGWLAEAEAMMPWGRLIVPEDVARLALFLLSDASIPMTGALVDQVQDSVLGVKD